MLAKCMAADGNELLAGDRLLECAGEALDSSVFHGFAPFSTPTLNCFCVTMFLFNIIPSIF